VLFSHPADFTPVCTAEHGLTAKLASEFEKRNVKTIALSVDSAEYHVWGLLWQCPQLWLCLSTCGAS
jgi:alkyl hydroperoxide reductase subunit AhpC